MFFFSGKSTYRVKEEGMLALSTVDKGSAFGLTRLQPNSFFTYLNHFYFIECRNSAKVYLFTKHAFSPCHLDLVFSMPVTLLFFVFFILLIYTYTCYYRIL